MKHEAITVGMILKTAFDNFGIQVAKEPTLIQWVTREYGVSRREINSMQGFIASFADNGDYHIQLEDVIISAADFEPFKIASMDIEVTLENRTWTNIKIYSQEEELPSRKYADSKILEERLNSIIEIVQRVLSFLLLIWEAIKAAKGFFSS